MKDILTIAVTSSAGPAILSKMSEKASDPVVVSYAQHSQVLVEGLWNFLTTKYRVEEVPWGGGLFKAHHLILDVFLPPERLKRSAKMTDDRHCHLELLLEFLYRGTVTVKRDRLDGLLRVAKEMDFQMLVDAVTLASSNAGGGRGKRKRNRVSSRPWEPVIELMAVDSAAQDDGQLVPPKTVVADDDTSTLLDRWNLEFENIVSKPNDDSDSKEDVGTPPKAKLSKSGGVRPRATASKRHKCPECDYESANANVIKSHLAVVHSKTKPFRCAHCPYASCWNGVLKRHVMTVHSMDTSLFTPESSSRRLSSGFEKGTYKLARTQEKTFKCPQCEQVFSQNQNLKSHINVAHGNGAGSFECETCTKCCSSSSEMDAHKLTHAQDKPFKCPHCEQEFSQKQNLKSHISVAHGIGASSFECETCGKRCGGRARLIEHRRTHTQERPFKCPHCDKGFNQTSNLNSHVRAVHEQGNASSNFVCDTCGKVSKSRSGMIEHQRTHTQERPYKCPHCGKGFNQTSNRNSHIARMHVQGPSGCFACDVCGKRSKTRAGIVEHQRIHALERRHKCPHCGRGFNQKTNLNSHVARVHAQGRPSGYFVCETCGKQSTSRAHLIEHQRTHTQERPFKCPHCDKGFNQRSNLNSHVNVVHGMGPRGCFVCETCGKQCDSRARLGKHQRTHNQERPHKCPQCIYAASNKHSLAAHMDVVHGLGTSRFVCETCGKRCYSRALYVRHNLTHTKEKPFKCEHCPYACSQKATLKQHVDTLHGVGRFRCETCGKSLHSMSLLIAHRRTHTQEKPFECPHCSHRANRKENLDRHVDVVHGQGTGKYPCETCGKSLNSAGQLSRHKRTHARDKQPELVAPPAVQQEQQLSSPCLLEKCPHCGHMAVDGPALTEHVYVEHGVGPSPLECEACGKQCPSVDELTRHKLIHAWENPFNQFRFQPMLQP